MPHHVPPGVSGYIDQLVDAICSRGFLISQDPDLGRWREAMSAAPGIAAVNPTFDPAHHDFERGGPFYWLRVSTHGEGSGRPCKMAAMIAFRLIDTDAAGSPGGWRSWLETGRLFTSTLVPLSRGVLLHPSNCDWRGRIGHHGGLWVDPDIRRSGLAYLLTHLVRAISIRDYDVDHHCGVVLDDLLRRGIPLKPTGYGYPRAVPSLEGYVVAAGRPVLLHSTHITRSEMIDQIAVGPALEALAGKATAPEPALLAATG